MTRLRKISKHGAYLVIKKAQEKITRLFASILETPFAGEGKPEGLKHELTGKWSRRINSEERLIYELKENKILIYSLKGHYD